MPINEPRLPTDLLTWAPFPPPGHRRPRRLGAFALGHLPDLWQPQKRLDILLSPATLDSLRLRGNQVSPRPCSFLGTTCTLRFPGACPVAPPGHLPRGAGTLPACLAAIDAVAPVWGAEREARAPPFLLETPPRGPLAPAASPFQRSAPRGWSAQESLCRPGPGLTFPSLQPPRAGLGQPKSPTLSSPVRVMGRSLPPKRS